MSRIHIPNNDHTRMDPSYRYQRNQLVASKTKQFYVIENLDLICTQLKVDKSEFIAYIPKYLKQGIKMFGDKIGVKIQSEHVLEEMLESFILEYIICPKCSYPEIELDSKSDNYLVCNGCGHNCKGINTNANDSKLLAESISDTSSKPKLSAKEQKALEKNAKKQAILNSRSAKKSNKESAVQENPDFS
jgi:translation initiation factor 2 beta subunit (eIF-2beta)/eIF-5